MSPFTPYPLPRQGNLANYYRQNFLEVGYFVLINSHVKPNEPPTAV
ncbi:MULTISPECIES: hypothetical protein [unclassified Nostoc]|nr:hypothetical protein [Nostoc sp. DedQUE03]MDZ7973695.1 hypothetical protein [Nostoc sp. DedQUE03]MDZ8048179.1 hypothetical protein [Nostoc sp. DedQUE02]